MRPAHTHTRTRVHTRTPARPPRRGTISHLDVGQVPDALWQRTVQPVPHVAEPAERQVQPHHVLARVPVCGAGHSEPRVVVVARVRRGAARLVESAPTRGPDPRGGAAGGEVQVGERGQLGRWD